MHKLTWHVHRDDSHEYETSCRVPDLENKDLNGAEELGKEIVLTLSPEGDFSQRRTLCS